VASVMWDWPDASIERVIDGDSIVARLTRDLGFHGTVSFLQKLRLNRINTPKVSTDNGRDAKEALEVMVKDQVVRVRTLKAYKYGDEWMAEIFLADNTIVSDALVKQGHAVYWDGIGQRPADS
jgi:endonuclease YncB( thermonuclease family)